MSDLYKIIRTFQISPKVLVSKFSEIPLKKVAKIILKRNVYNNSSYSKSQNSNFSISKLFICPKISYLEIHKDLIFASYKQIQSHQFDLLGSGLVNVSHQEEYKGFQGSIYHSKIQYGSIKEYIANNININNQQIALEYSSLLSHHYTLIYWQRDFRSGYRWDESKWARELSYGSLTGADVKVPWELGRLQHLPIMAYTYALASKHNSDFSPIEILTEFQNQIIDFYISNPPSFGIQWGCAMDVSIRLVNIMVAVSFFEQYGAEFSDKFKELLSNMFNDHIQFVANNLEWSGGMRGNHYFANICGLVIACLYLKDHQEYFDILYMAVSEFANEIMHQFNPDGSNFEASLPYHYFCFEMLIYTLSALQAQSGNVLHNIFKRTESKFLRIDNNNPILHKKLINRIISIINFSETFLENNNTYNIGDNDSGKFLKLMPDAHYTTQTNNDKANSLLNVQDLLNYIKANSSLHCTILATKYELFKFISVNDTNSTVKSFKDFGIYLFNTNQYSATFRCGSVGQNGKGGHAHNDQLSLCLKVRGIDVFVDNGTYTYTSNPELRNLYRSTAMHNTLSLDNMEQNEWANSNKDDLFWLKSLKAKPKVIEITNNSITAEHVGFGVKHTRTIKFHKNSIEGIDRIPNDLPKKVHFYLNPNAKITSTTANTVMFNVSNIKLKLFSEHEIQVKEYNHSPSYGIIEQGIALIIPDNSEELSWAISIIE